jgi:outer membrane biosynthesis protein TonB
VAKSGNNTKYILGGLLLLGAAVGMWMLLQQPPPAPAAAPAPPPKPAEPERVNPMAQPDLILEEEKDAGVPVPQAVAPKRTGPKVVRDEWDCQGDVERAALQRVIDANRVQIRNCYERRLKVNNILQGDLKLKMKIGSSGNMALTSVTGTLRDSEVFGCVKAIAQKWNFPPPSGGNCAVVQVPFQFAPKQ